MVKILSIAGNIGFYINQIEGTSIKTGNNIDTFLCWKNFMRTIGTLRFMPYKKAPSPYLAD